MIDVKNYPANNPTSGPLALDLRDRLKHAGIHAVMHGSIHRGYTVSVAEGFAKSARHFISKEQECTSR